MVFYIIEHTEQGTRYIDGVDTDQERAERIAENVTDGFLLRGYFAPTVQEPRQEPDETARVSIVKTYQTRNAEGDTITVELFKYEQNDNLQ